MKIRLMGPPDIVRAWSKTLESSFDASVAEYPCRGNSGDIRAYIDIDDRKAAIFAAAEQVDPSHAYRGQAGARARWEAYYKEHPEKRKANRAKGAKA